MASGSVVVVVVVCLRVGAMMTDDDDDDDDDDEMILRIGKVWIQENARRPRRGEGDDDARVERESCEKKSNPVRSPVAMAWGLLFFLL